MSGTAVKMTAENLGELLGLFARKAQTTCCSGVEEKARKRRTERVGGRRDGGVGETAGGEGDEGRRDRKGNHVRHWERDSSEKTESGASEQVCCIIQTPAVSVAAK